MGNYRELGGRSRIYCDSRAVWIIRQRLVLIRNSISKSGYAWYTVEEEHRLSGNFTSFNTWIRRSIRYVGLCPPSAQPCNIVLREKAAKSYKEGDVGPSLVGITEPLRSIGAEFLHRASFAWRGFRQATQHYSATATMKTHVAGGTALSYFYQGPPW